MLKALAQRWQGVAVEGDPRLLGLREGHPEVIEDALLALMPRVRGWCYRRLGPHAALEDVMQEVLIELARALPNFRGQSSLVTYAYRICVRGIARQRRRKWIEPVLSDTRIEAEASDACDPERATIEREALRTVLACLSRLPARRREAFVLCELEGETPEQAARMLGTTANAVRSRLMHARHELERRLRGYAGPGKVRGAR